MGSDTHDAPAKKVLVAYYSLSGNTARVAHDIAIRTGADIESIRDPGHGTGFVGFLKSCIDALRGVSARIGPLRRDFTAYDLTVIGTPVWAGRMTPAIRAYLQITQGKLGRVGFFVTSGNTDVTRLLPALESVAGTKAFAAAGFSAKDLKRPDVYERTLAVFLNALGLPQNGRKPFANSGEGLSSDRARAQAVVQSKRLHFLPRTHQPDSMSSPSAE